MTNKHSASVTLDAQEISCLTTLLDMEIEYESKGEGYLDAHETVGSWWTSVVLSRALGKFRQAQTQIQEGCRVSGKQ